MLTLFCTVHYVLVNSTICLSCDVYTRALHGPPGGPARSGRAVKFLAKIGPGRAGLSSRRAWPVGPGPACDTHTQMDGQTDSFTFHTTGRSQWPPSK